MLLERGSLLVVAALALGCATNGASETGGPTDGPTIDLSVDGLTDVNPTSATANQTVDAKDYQGAVSAWYFGHST